MTDNPLKRLHGLTMSNRGLIEAAGEGVCIFCGVTSPAKNITEWIEDRAGDTACCPKCHIDAVLPLITPQLREALRDRYFRPLEE